MKKSLKKKEEEKRSRSLTLHRETILTLTDPLLELAWGGAYDPSLPNESFTVSGNS